MQIVATTQYIITGITDCVAEIVAVVACGRELAGLELEEFEGELEAPECHHILLETRHVGGVDTSPVVAQRNDRLRAEEGFVVVVIGMFHHQGCRSQVEIESLFPRVQPETTL